MASTGTAPKPRPISPHLEIYRPSITMVMSITHRISGVGLYVGVAVLAWFLLALSGDSASFSLFAGFIHSILGRVILFGFTWALFHHLMGGVRHALMDSGLGLDAPLRDRFAQAQLAGGIGLTLLAWVIGYAVR